MKWLVEYEEIKERREGLDYYTVFTITFTSRTYIAGPDAWLLNEDMVMKYVRAFYNRPFKEKGEERDWAEAYLEECKKLDKNKWQVTIVKPYTD